MILLSVVYTRSVAEYTDLGVCTENKSHKSYRVHTQEDTGLTHRRIQGSHTGGYRVLTQEDTGLTHRRIQGSHTGGYRVLTQELLQGCKFSDFCLISENFTSKYLKIFFEISSL